MNNKFLGTIVESAKSVLTTRNVLTVASLALMGLTQIVNGKMTEEDTRELIRDELQKFEKKGEADI